MKQIGIRVDVGQRLRQKQFGGDGGLADFVELRFEQADGIAERFIDIYAHKLRGGHLRKIAEAPNDGIEIGKLGFQSCR